MTTSHPATPSADSTAPSTRTSPLPRTNAPLSTEDAGAEIGPRGIDGFYWPVSIADKEAVRDHLQTALVELLRRELPKCESHWQALRILLYEILNEVLTVYQAQAAVNRAAAAGRPFRVPQTYRLYHAVSHGGRLPAPREAGRLRDGLPRPGRWLMPARALRNLFIRDAFLRRRLHRISPDRDVVTVDTAPFVQQHARLFARETGRRVIYCSLWEWFWLGAAERRELHARTPLDAACVGQTVELIAKAFAAGGERLTPQVADHFRAWIGETGASVQFHFERLLTRPDRLPKVLWYGSQNNIWMRLLRAAVKASGGRLIGYDHGCGVGLCPNRGEYGAVLDLCDEYVAYSPLLARSYAERLSDIAYVLPSDDRPKFTGRPDLASSPPPDAVPESAVCRGAQNEPTVMFLTRLHLRERNTGLNCLAADLPTFDWQARLFTHLSDWGYTVHCKLHPECRFPLPDRLRRDTGVVPSSDDLQKAVQAADIVVFDFLSSAFKPLAFTDVAIVFVDFGQGDMTPEVRSVLERRCAIVPGRYDRINRAQVDWNALRGALDLAMQRRFDRTCREALYGA